MRSRAWRLVAVVVVVVMAEVFVLTTLSAAVGAVGGRIGSTELLVLFTLGAAATILGFQWIGKDDS